LPHPSRRVPDEFRRGLPAPPQRHASAIAAPSTAPFLAPRSVQLRVGLACWT